MREGKIRDNPKMKILRNFKIIIKVRTDSAVYKGNNSLDWREIFDPLMQLWFSKKFKEQQMMYLF